MPERRRGNGASVQSILFQVAAKHYRFGQFDMEWQAKMLQTPAGERILGGEAAAENKKRVHRLA